MKNPILTSLHVAMKAISLLQPWASLMVLPSKENPDRPCKIFETRSWPTHYRGPIAIASSKTFPIDCQSLTEAEPYASSLSPIPEFGLPLGCILGVGFLTDCIPVAEALHHPRMNWLEQRFGNYSPNRYAFLIQEMRPLPDPIPCKGSLSLWPVPSDLQARILIQLPGLADRITQQMETLAAVHHALGVQHDLNNPRWKRQ